MPKFVRWSIVMLATFMASLGGSGLAQPSFPEPILRGALGAQIYGVFQEAFVHNPDERASGLALVAAMQDGASAMQGSGDVPGSYSTCASLLGAGSNPKLDGGGNLLASLPGGVQPSSLIVAPGDLAAGLAPLVEYIVIIDDFALGALEDSFASAGSPLRLDPDDGYERLWSVLYVSEASADPTVASEVPHGHLVALHALSHLISETAQILAATRFGDTLQITVQVDTSSQVEVRLSAIKFDDVASIGKAIEETELGNSANVVNMSWGLVDCTLDALYSDSASAGTVPAYPTFVDYLKAALAAGGESERVIRDLCRLFKTRIDVAITTDTIDCEGNVYGLLDVATIATMAAMSVQAAEDIGLLENHEWKPVSAGVFASAGNQGLPFPMPPAAWPGIVGVEACYRSMPQRANFSNVGSLGSGSVYPDEAVRALGAWFATPVSSDGTDGAASGTPLGYWGTSFAAPAAAMHYSAAERGWKGIGSDTTEVLPTCQP